MALTRIYDLIDNYIYLYHTDTLLIIPTYPESMTDNSSASFNTTTPLGRTAPIYSYTSSGPRSISFDFKLHRDMMWQANHGITNKKINPNEDMDYVDLFIKEIEAAVLPTYALSLRMIDPPLVAVRMSNDVYIKGVINGSIGISYDLPINKNNKYSVIGVSFVVSEVTPFDAEIVESIGSYRDVGDIKLNVTGDVNVYVSGANESGSMSPMYGRTTVSAG